MPQNIAAIFFSLKTEYETKTMLYAKNSPPMETSTLAATVRFIPSPG
jgi:hypothetical protein